MVGTMARPIMLVVMVVVVRSVRTVMTAVMAVLLVSRIGSNINMMIWTVVSVAMVLGPMVTTSPIAFTVSPGTAREQKYSNDCQ